MFPGGVEMFPGGVEMFPGVDKDCISSISDFPLCCLCNNLVFFCATQPRCLVPDTKVFIMFFASNWALASC